MATKLIELRDGILVEVRVPADQAQQISGGLADKVKTGVEFIEPLLLKICHPIVAAWHKLDHELDVEKATVELGLSFEGEGNIFITKSKASANLTITLEFKRKAASKIHEVKE